MLNRGYAYATIISGKYHGQTLLSHLASLYPHSTRQAWQQNLNNGEVTLNGDTATGSESVASGQTLVWNRPPWIEPDAPQHFEVLFEDRHLLAVNKPGGLPTLPGGGFMENTLLRLVQKRTPNASPVHRLGRATTGIVLFARTPQAASNLFANWNTPNIQKIYRALGQNIAQHDAYEILTPIGLVPHPLIGSVWAANPSGKPAKSLAKVISRSTSTRTGTTTFEVSLNSGRPHQIRIHLASIGHPLVGDPLYGSTGQPLENLPGLPGDGGYFLHAQYLKFLHPITGEQVNLEAALPSAFPLHPVEKAESQPVSSNQSRHVTMISEHIEERQGVYYVPGTRISLDSIVYAFREGCSPETIREDFAGLTLAHVHGAIAFYLDHQTEIDAYLSRRREQWAELERQGTPPSPDLQARLERARHSVSPPAPVKPRFQAARTI